VLHSFDWRVFSPLNRQEIATCLALKRGLDASSLSLDAVLNEKLLITSDEEAYLHAIARRREHHEPLTKILQTGWFYGYTFTVTPDVLDPRMDSEILIQTVQSYFPDGSAPLNILDLGTGSGCLVITLLLEYIKALGVGVDLCPKALAVARCNARAHGVQDRLRLQESDWLSRVDGIFDVVIANPPYIEEDYPLSDSVRDFDPPLALFGGKDGLSAYRSILHTLSRVIHNTSLVFFEIGYNQAATVTALLEDHGYCILKIVKDLSHHDRVIVAQKTK